jgi:hypothetical protein
MWYVAHLLFAQKPGKGKKRVLCESCRVLFRAKSALKCHERALIWANRRKSIGNFHFIGVQHINPLDNERPNDGSEIGGSFYEAYNIWQRAKMLIPKRDKIPIVRFEAHRNMPVGKMMTSKQKRIGRKIFARR